jgi:hypothetical protein
MCDIMPETKQTPQHKGEIADNETINNDKSQESSEEEKVADTI